MGSQFSSMTETYPVATRSPSTACQRPPFRFLDLPPELRMLIYGELVVVGRVFFSPDWYEIEEGRRFDEYKQSTRPNLAILRVSRAVHDEAEDIYLSKNIFVLPPLWNYVQPARLDGDETRYIWDVSGSSLLLAYRKSGISALRSVFEAQMCRAPWVIQTGRNSERHNLLRSVNRLQKRG